MTTTTTMDEFSGLLETFKQLVKAGVQANLSAWTYKEGNLKAKLDVKFCRAATPSLLPSKPPVSPPVAQAPGQPAAGRRRKRRGPAARERARARAACYRAAKAVAAAAQGGSSSASEGYEVSSPPEQTPPPPPQPLTTTARLIRVVERKADSGPTFSQLDGEGGSEVDIDSEEETEGEGELIRGVVYCIFCCVLKEPNPVEPTSFINKFGMKPTVQVSCDICNVKGIYVGICYNCHCMNEFYARIYNNQSTCRLCRVAALADSKDM